MPIVKVEVRTCRDKRFKKRATISTRDTVLVYDEEMTPAMVKKMDGSVKSFFLASVSQDPVTNKTLVVLDARVNPQNW